MPQSQGDVTTQWTPKEITARLGISIAVFQKHLFGAREIATIREAGITCIELSCVPRCFDYRNKHQVSEIVSESQKQRVTIVSVHGPFNLPYNLADEENFAVRRILAYGKVHSFHLEMWNRVEPCLLRCLHIGDRDFVPF